MHILYLVHQFYPHTHGGTEKFLLELACYCQAAGHTVTIVTYDGTDASPARVPALWRRLSAQFRRRNLHQLALWWRNATHRAGCIEQPQASPTDRYHLRSRRYTYQGLAVIACTYDSLPPDFFSALHESTQRAFAAAVLAELQPDVLHAAHAHRTAEFLHVAAEQGLPYLLTLTDFWPLCPNCRLQTARGHLCMGPQGGAACRRECPLWPSEHITARLGHARRLLTGASAIVAPTRVMAGRVQAEHGALPIQLIPYGMPTDRLPVNVRHYAPSTPITFGYAGALQRFKGVHLLVAAFKRLAAPQARLEIYGAGPLEAHVRREATDDSRIRVGGVYAPDQLGAILQALDVMVVPSLWHENLPLTMLEAQAGGVPVLVSDVAGLTECVTDGVNGFTFHMGDVEDLLRKLQWIVNRPDLLNSIKAKLRRPATGQYRISSVAETGARYLDLYGICRAQARRAASTVDERQD
jgi:glycosyltransferase involved in cell wall biosynthesis